MPRLRSSAKVPRWSWISRLLEVVGWSVGGCPYGHRQLNHISSQLPSRLHTKRKVDYGQHRHCAYVVELEWKHRAPAPDGWPALVLHSDECGRSAGGADAGAAERRDGPRF